MIAFAGISNLAHNNINPIINFMLLGVSCVNASSYSERRSKISPGKGNLRPASKWSTYTGFHPVADTPQARSFLVPARNKTVLGTWYYLTTSSSLLNPLMEVA
ncbi:hypothetical protein SLE2022_029810 [Rubroshorea leprosula]